MSNVKRTSKRKSRSKSVPVLGAAGLLSLAGGASAATGVPAADLQMTQKTAPSHEVTLGEEEISDVSLATFYVFDKENAGKPQFSEKLAWWRGCGGCGWRGCRGCGGCGGCCASWGRCRFC
jgi:hypothetical protein